MWDFLIQKEGEPKWQSLKNNKNSLFEGRYRLVLHSDLKITDVEVSILYTDHFGKPQPVKTYLKKTNAQGLMVILTYTDLKAGLWQFTCSSRSTEETGHQEKIRLLILAKDNEPKEMFSQEQAELEELIKLEIEPYLEKHSAQALVRAKLLPNLQIILNQNSFFSLQGEVVPIFGYIEMKETEFPYLILSNFKLRYSIQDPQTSQTLVNGEQTISIDHLPFEFQYFLELPSNLKTNQMSLEQTTFTGEVILETLTPSINIVDSQTFSLITEPPGVESENFFTPTIVEQVTLIEEVPVVETQPVSLYLVPPTPPTTNHPALPPRLSEKGQKRKEVTLPMLPKNYQGQQ